MVLADIAGALSAILAEGQATIVIKPFPDAARTYLHTRRSPAQWTLDELWNDA